MISFTRPNISHDALKIIGSGLKVVGSKLKAKKSIMTTQNRNIQRKGLKMSLALTISHFDSRKEHVTSTILLLASISGWSGSNLVTLILGLYSGTI